ncbi:hypothetical protein RZ517_12565 [Roseovarius sp. S88]|uniref:Uncharacterized protein n=1 Tax=Roseovarius phycicola TaxID=3080976 RepID=A0ABZ2HCW2_9RHOB
MFEETNEDPPRAPTQDPMSLVGKEAVLKGGSADKEYIYLGIVQKGQ